MPARTPAKLRNEQFAKNITKRGSIKNTEKEQKSKLSPMLVGFFLFVVVGSAVFELIRTATKGVFES